MKKSTGIIIASLVVVGGLVVTYRAVNSAPSSNLTSDEQMQEIITSGDCMRCHSANPQLPIYANWPIVGSLIQKDVTKGYRAFDMTEMTKALQSGQPVGKVILAKIEKTMMDGKMPMHPYYLIHWGSTTTDAKKEQVSTWARQHRLAYYANALVAADLINEPIRPIADSVSVDMRKVVLGNMLFHDTRLSADNTISCASCHGLNTGGVDNKQYSEGVGGQFGGVNAPTVYNAFYNMVQFWDGRANTLAEQAAGPPLNPIEMACKSFDEIIAKLQQDANFTKAFAQVYPDGYSEKNITNAIEEFEKTLLTPNSRFDRYLKGDKNAISQTELAGYKLFKKYDCATCHVGEILGGQSYELMGVKRDYFADRQIKLTEEDNGRFKQTKTERDRHRFKVPGLRNIALTAPYFHDGSMKTMKEAVDYMAKYQMDMDLADEELHQIVAFFETLTGEHKGKLLQNDNHNKAL